jgi:hypothetical protein
MSSWAEAEVNDLNAHGVISAALQNGSSYLGQDNFKSIIRRDEFMALMVNIYELVKGQVTTYRSPFSDISDSDYKTAIDWFDRRNFGDRIYTGRYAHTLDSRNT